MSDLYWYLEYGKVLAAYVALLYLWPSVLFRAYLRGKGMTYRFLFCVTVPVLLYNGVVLGLGLLHILNVWLVRALFYGAFFLSVGIPLLQREGKGPTLWKLLHTPLRRRSLKMQAACFWDRTGERRAAFLRNCRRHWIEYLILTALLLFGVMFYSYPALRNPNYGCYDAFTHTSWLFSMRQGKIFPNGVYPQGMHCFIYGLNTLFGVKIYSCMLYLAGIHITAFLLSAYFLLRELFRCRYTPLFVVTLFLTFDGCVSDEVRYNALMSMTRLTWTLPQEFGWYLVFLCPLLLLRFLREEDGQLDANRWFENPNLLLLAAAAGATFAIHFYVTVLAVFFCAVAALLHVKKILPAHRFRTLFYTAWDGMIAGSLPMLAAYILGEKLDNSLRWGIHTLQGRTGMAAEMITNQEVPAVEAGQGFWDGFYEKGYSAIFGRFGGLLLALALLVLAAAVCLWIYRLSRRGRKGWRPGPELERYAGYLLIAAASVIMIFLYAARFMGLPEFISVDRLFAILRVFVYALIWIPVDFLLSLAFRGRFKRVLRCGAVFACVGVYCVSFLVDFHEFGFWEVKRLEAAVKVTAEITEKFQPGSYMVISMQDEQWQVEDLQSCVPLLDFVQTVEKSWYYTLPAEYLFLYVEKQPIKVGTKQFFAGPGWLGKPSSQYSKFENSKWYPDVLKGSIFTDAAETKALDYEELKLDYFNSYLDPEVREALCAKAYAWYQDFSEAHPVETNVYYEDEDFVCYVIHQNPEKLLNLTMRGQRNGR